MWTHLSVARSPAHGNYIHGQLTTYQYKIRAIPVASSAKQTHHAHLKDVAGDTSIAFHGNPKYGPSQNMGHICIRKVNAIPNYIAANAAVTMQKLSNLGF